MPIPQISLVIPTKNRAKLICETLDSVTSQAFADWEVIVVDDGSDDETKDVVRRYAKADHRIHLLDRKGLIAGANVCRNQGARSATADLLVFLDSDDLLAVDCLGSRVAFMGQNMDVDFLVCHATAFIDQPGDLKKPASHFSFSSDLDRFLYFDPPWLISGPTWRKASFLALGGFDETIPSWQDIDLHIRAILSVSFYHNSRTSDYHVRWQNDPSKTSLRQHSDPDHLSEGERVVDNFFTLLTEANELTWSRLRAIAGLKFSLCEKWMNIGRPKNAFELWRKARLQGQVRGVVFYYSGLFLLWLLRMPLFEVGIVKRIVNKWKGLVRLRLDPELLNSLG